MIDGEICVVFAAKPEVWKDLAAKIESGLAAKPSSFLMCMEDKLWKHGSLH